MLRNKVKFKDLSINRQLNSIIFKSRLEQQASQDSFPVNTIKRLNDEKRDDYFS